MKRTRPDEIGNRNKYGFLKKIKVDEMMKETNDIAIQSEVIREEQAIGEDIRSLLHQLQDGSQMDDKKFSSSLIKFRGLHRRKTALFEIYKPIQYQSFPKGFYLLQDQNQRLLNEIYRELVEVSSDYAEVEMQEIKEILDHIETLLSYSDDESRFKVIFLIEKLEVKMIRLKEVGYDFWWSKDINFSSPKKMEIERKFQQLWQRFKSINNGLIAQTIHAESPSTCVLF